jgi:hypothetical protein
MTFRVITNFDAEHAKKVVKDIRRRGFKVVDVLSADIERDNTNEKVGECLALVCKGNMLRYRKFKNELIEKFGLKEIVWEGFKTLC